jgi:hypothetical protein
VLHEYALMLACAGAAWFYVGAGARARRTLALGALTTGAVLVALVRAVERRAAGRSAE